MNTGLPSLNNRSSSVASLPTADNSPTPKTSDSDSAQPSAPQQLSTPVDKTSAVNRTRIAAEKASPSLQEVIQLSERLNESIQKIQRDISFSVDDSLGDIVIKVVDRETQELIRQIPSEEMLNISRNIEEVKSLLFDKIKA